METVADFIFLGSKITADGDLNDWADWLTDWASFHVPVVCLFVFFGAMSA